MILSIVIPCLNEEETIGAVIDSCSKEFEIVVADNGSTDTSVQIASNSIAVVVVESRRGYGSAIMAGAVVATGDYLFIIDADQSYSTLDADRFLQYAILNNLDLVVGCRFDRCGGEIMPCAMPWLHRYIGNPILSFIGRKLFGIGIGDFHCGMRLVNRKMLLNLGISATGMEFASEMIILSHLSGMKIGEIGIKLYKSGRIKSLPHLRPFRDGFRHLFMMLKLYYASKQ